jgi:hypothetical protein
MNKDMTEQLIDSLNNVISTQKEMIEFLKNEIARLKSSQVISNVLLTKTTSDRITTFINPNPFVPVNPNPFLTGGYPPTVINNSVDSDKFIITNNSLKGKVTDLTISNC